MTTFKEEHSLVTQSQSHQYFVEQYQKVRHFTEQLCEPLVTEDYIIQSMPDVSPTKWHIAHVTWFWETFLLAPALPDYQSLHPQYAYLFNSYYNTLGQRHCRPKRGLISRPTVEETYAYRRYVDEHVLDLLGKIDEGQLSALAPIMTLGLHHEQQHQELMLTDMKHVLSCNPLYPSYIDHVATAPSHVPALEWVSFPEGVYWIGHEGDGFAFDNEGPRHRQFVQSFQLASRLVTNGEYLAFMEDGGYKNPLLWLSEGWATVQQEEWAAPLYWEQRDGRWWTMTLSGLHEVDPAEPVCHVSYFEADAYARWADARLPTEAEWEVAAQDVPVQGNFVESGLYRPAPLAAATTMGNSPRCMATYGNGPKAPTRPIRTSRPVRGQSGNTMGSSCATSMSCVVAHVPPLFRISGPPTATSFLPTPNGNLWASD